jgi:hypothetical protein
MKQWIQSWKKYCPDYAVVEWNEENFDFSSNLYAKQAYEAKKWAFVSDYARVHVLYHQGGVYLDTDMELLKPLDPFLEHRAFSGFETKKTISTGIMGCERGHPLFKALLSDYDGRVFVKENGTFDYTTNVETVTDYCLALGFVPDNKKQTVEDFTIYPMEYFSPTDPETNKTKLTANTCAIHHFQDSWVPVLYKKWIWIKIRRAIKRTFPFVVSVEKKLFPDRYVE